MRNLWHSFKFSIKDWFASSGESRPAPDGMAKTIRDATHVRGTAGYMGGGQGGTNGAIAKHAAKGHDAYQKSFKKDC